MIHEDIIRYKKLDGPEQIPWKEIHEAGDKGMLSGSNAETVLRFHQLKRQQFRSLDVMDVGVGMGQMSNLLTSAVGREGRVVCVDIVPEAKQRIAKGADFYTIEQLPIPDRAVDAAICHLVMQHCDDTLAHCTLSQIRLSMKKGGWMAIQMAGATGEVPGDRGDVVWRSEPACRRLLENSGWKVQSCKVIDRFLPIRWFMFRVGRG